MRFFLRGAACVWLDSVLFVEVEFGKVTVAIMMNKIGRFLVERHWDIVKVVFPSSVLFGFMYTMNYGTSPLEDAKQRIVGSSARADVLSIRLSGSMGHRGS